MNNHKVFISFSSKDSALALKIYDRLNRRGIKSWISARDIPPGADYQSAIVKAIEETEIVVLVFSSRAASSNEIIKELSLASKKVIIPARVEDIEPQDAFKYQLSNRQFIDLFDDFERNLDGLVDEVSSLLPEDSIRTKTSSKVVLWFGRLKYQFFGLCKKVAIPLLLLSIVVGGLASIDKEKLYSSVLSTLANWTDGFYIDLPGYTANDRLLADVSDMRRHDNYRDSERIKLIKKAMPDLTAPLTAKEAVVLLKGLNGSSRAKGIVTIINGLTDNLSGDELALIMVGVSESTRFDLIDDFKKADRIKTDLLASDVVEILKGTSASYRTASIKVIASQIADNLKGEELGGVLGDTEGSKRHDAIVFLNKANKIKAGLSSSDATAILKGTSSSYRAASIRVIASLIADNLKGEELGMILGDTEGSKRHEAIVSLNKANKIKAGLSSSEAAAILKGTSSSYRAASIQVFASQIRSNLKGEELGDILADMEGSKRYDSIVYLNKADKIKVNLSAPEVAIILKGISSSYREKIMKIIASHITRNLQGDELYLTTGNLEARA